MFNKPKSPETLVSKTYDPDAMLWTMNKNLLYITHKVDKCLDLLKKMQIDDNAQKQVDDFYDHETSPQTDTDEQ